MVDEKVNIFINERIRLVENRLNILYILCHMNRCIYFVLELKIKLTYLRVLFLNLMFHAKSSFVYNIPNQLHIECHSKLHLITVE